jgi:hypothetical protein
MSIRYSYLGDLQALLVPPAASGLNPFVLFSQVGQPALTFGSPLSLSADPSGNDPGTYTFNDHTTGDIWLGFDKSTGNADYSSLAANLPPDSYRTTVPGPWDITTNPRAGQFTSLAADSEFIGLLPSKANGTWILEVRSGSSSEPPTGEVTGAHLDITTVPEPADYWLLSIATTIFGFSRLLAGARIPRPQT